MAGTTLSKKISKREFDARMDETEIGRLYWTEEIEKHRAILLERQKILRAVCEKIILYDDGRVEIQGMLDGSEALSIGLESAKRAQSPDAIQL